jgi:streptogramin lyase
MASMARTRLFGVILIFQAAILSSPRIGTAQSVPPAALTGIVSSQEEGPMEGVLVSVKKAGSTVTVTVASDQQGRYSFPRNRLEPGQYALHIRAVGYDLEDPGHVDIAARKTTTLDLKLHKTQDLAAQLSNAEWLISVPGTEQQKERLQCSLICHTTERIVRSHHNAAEWVTAGRRMGTEFSPAEAEYLSSINLSTVSQWAYPLKTLPRPKGKSTRVIITEYDLPHGTKPHDITMDSKGMVWYCDDSDHYLGFLNPQTAKVMDYPVPVIRKGVTTECRTVEFDSEGTPWLSMQQQGAVAMFDRKTEDFKIWSVPQTKGAPREGAQRVSGALAPVDGKMWVQTPSGGRPHGTKIEWRLQRLDVNSGEWEAPIDVFRDIPKNSPAANRPHIIYAILTDSKNNLFFSDFASEYIGRIEAKTGKIDLFPTPTFNSGPRRLHVDAQDRLWFGEERADRIGMFDARTEKFQEWTIPTPFAGPYDVVVDKAGYVWTGGMKTDHVARLNQKTGEIVEYMLPRETNIRKVEIDNSTNPPTFWTGNDHWAAIVKLEVLE